MQRVSKGIAGGLIVLSYPALVYFLLAHDLPWIGAMLVLGLVIWKLRDRKNGAVLVGALLAMAASVAYFTGPAFISKIVPFLIHLALFSLFWQSLKTIPLITRFARLDFPEIPPEIEVYCRQLTIVWACFFAGNAIVCIALALADNNTIWALYNGFVVYLLIALLVVGEYAWRKYRFPDLEIPTLRQSVSNIMKRGPQIWNHNG